MNFLIEYNKNLCSFYNFFYIFTFSRLIMKLTMVLVVVVLALQREILLLLHLHHSEQAEKQGLDVQKHLRHRQSQVVVLVQHNHHKLECHLTHIITVVVCYQQDRFKLMAHNLYIQSVSLHVVNI